MPDWLTPEVRAALEACPVEWTHDGSWPKNLLPSNDPAPTPSARRWIISRSSDATRFFWPECAIPDDAALAMIEKHWREECERRGVEFSFHTETQWAWMSADGRRSSFGKPMAWLACLADAIMVTQPKEVPNGEVH